MGLTKFSHMVIETSELSLTESARGAGYGVLKYSVVHVILDARLCSRSGGWFCCAADH